MRTKKPVLLINFWAAFLNIMLANPGFGSIPSLQPFDPNNPMIEKEGHKFVLNGQAVHTVTIFGFKVYEIFLFLEKPSQDSTEILESATRKMLFLKFLRDIDASKLRDALTKGFRENCSPKCELLANYLDELNLKIPNFKEGDGLLFEFLPDEVRLVLERQKSTSEIKNAEFSRILLSIWLGPDPPTSELKKKILGY